jgi:cellulose synthase/poly-beta-1,6-N-acetylglucosamine synthase-like glycosyltransferase
MLNLPFVRVFTLSQCSYGNLLMLWAGKAFIVTGALLVFQSAWSLFDGFRFLGLVRRRLSRPRGSERPSAAVVIPCKGADAGFDANVDAFLNQDYPDYLVVFVVATATDVAYQKLKSQLETLAASGAIRQHRATLVVAGTVEGRGEKVNNLLHGVDVVDQAVEVLVFADVDATPSPDWLTSLVARLADPRVTVSTGFRWYLPGKGFVSRLRAAWDTSIATVMGDHDHNFAWGGSMAIRAADFRRLGIAERYWTNTVSDDYAMTRAVREAGGKIAFEPRCLVASREESSLRELLRWSTRQIIITRVYAAHLWKLGLAASLIYSGTFMLGLVLVTLPRSTGPMRVVVATTLFVVLLLGAGKGYIRSIVAREVFPMEIGNGASYYWLLSPVVPWIMLGNFVAAGFTRRIEWRGTEYELVSHNQVRVIRKPAV